MPLHNPSRASVSSSLACASASSLRKAGSTLNGALSTACVLPGPRAEGKRCKLKALRPYLLSRARDRTILFRCVAEDDLDDDSLYRRLIGHFRKPFAASSDPAAVLRERCETGFEAALFDELTAGRYFVQPQVICGGTRIDLVVEDASGRRIAIACDGDRCLGAEQWAEEMVQQLVLERAGWTVWRCFEANFLRYRSEVLVDLSRTLERVGIEAMAPGAEPSVPGANVQRRVLGKLGAAGPTPVVSLRRARSA